MQPVYDILIDILLLGFLVMVFVAIAVYELRDRLQ